MHVTATLEDAEALSSAAAELIACEPHVPYANFAPLTGRADSLLRIHRARLAGASAAIVARDAGGRPLAVAALDRRPFESNHFGIEMARIDQPLATDDVNARASALEMVYRAALELAGERGYRHLAARASTRDPAAGWVLQRLGATHVDTQVSWMATLDGERRGTPPAPSLRVAALEREELAALPPTAWRRLGEWAREGFDRGPLIFDFDLPRETSQTLYAAWTDKVMSGEWADAALVAFDGDEVVAFISMLTIDDLSEEAGAVVCGRGLGATLPDYKGLFTALQHEMVAVRPLGAAFMENETQVATVASINVYAKLGFRYLRSTSTFHLNIDRGSA